MGLHHRIQQPELDPVPIAHVMKDEIDDKCSDPCIKHCHHDCMHPSPSHNTLLIPPSPKSNHHISKPLIFMFCTIGLAFFFIFYITTRFQMLRHNSRRRNQRALDHDDVDGSDSGSNGNHLPVIDHPIWLINTPGLNQSVIDSITVIKYKTEERLVEGSDCSVCLGEFQEDESLRLLPKCSHAFHIPCIDTWLRSHTNCPLCRAPIVCDATNSTRVNVNSNGQLESTRMETSESFGAELGSNHQRGDNGASHRERLRDGSFVPLSSEHSSIANILENSSRCFNARNCELRVLSDLAEHLAKVEENLQPVRRSISMDSSSASMVYFVMASMTQPSQTEGCSDNGLVQIHKPNLNLESKNKNGSLSMHRLIKSSSFKRLHKGPVSMKRSFSASGKWFLTRYNSRSQNSILPF